MKILIISQYFWPENFKINSLCKILKKKYYVEVITSLPNYPNGEIFSDFKKNKNRYNKFFSIKITRAFQFKRGTGSSVRLFFNYFSFLFFALLKLLFVNKKFDLILTFAPSPIFVGILGVIFSKINNARSAIWVLDLWPQILKELGIIKSPIILGIISKVSNYIYNNTDIILAQSKSFKKIIERIVTNKKKKVFYFPSWTDSIKINKKKTHSKKIKILFTGNIGYAQNLNQVIKATEIIKNKFQNFEWIFVGDGRYKKKFVENIKSKNLEKYFKIYNFRKPENLKKFYKDADFCFLSLSEGYYLNCTIPAKLQTYMSMGKPVIASASGETKNIINKANCGFVSKPNNYKNLANIILQISTLKIKNIVRLGKNSKKYSEKEFNKKNVLNKFDQILKVCNLI